MTRILRNYFFWAYERGSFHYDIMVTTILLFIFVAPHFIDFHDKPITTIPLRSSEVLVKSSSANGNVFTYEVRAEDLGAASDDMDRQAALLRVIEPISGEVTLVGYHPITDAKGNVIAFEATVSR